VPALVRRSTDLGALPPEQAVRRLVLVLRRGPAQEGALRLLLREQLNRNSPQFHRWLSPSEFGEKFGVGDADTAVISRWLGAHGLKIDRLSQGRDVIEASGTAAEVAEAFATPLHRFRQNAEEFVANTQPPTLPAALAEVLAGPLSLNSIARKPAPEPLYNQGTGALQPHVLSPGDFAKLYNLAPLYSQGLTGKGATVAVVARADYPGDGVAAFRKLFLPDAPAALPTSVLNGVDPGPATNNSDANEAALDAEWAGAAAPGARVDFVVSQSTDVTDGVDLSAEYIVDHALAPIMSSSYGACELALGGPGSAANLFYQNLYEQAAAEGITVVVSSGDSGAAGCDPVSGGAAVQGLGVNGLASTPFDLAVGGTQLDDQIGNYWASQNSPSDQSSILGYIPEQTWNESCSVSVCGGFLGASGGGASSVYPKPDWQAGPGVPADGSRDIPDVSLDASLRVPYAYCQEGCLEPTGVEQATAVGTAAGTSASAQAFASALALLVQKTGSWQGLIAPELYHLAAQQPAGECDASGSPSTNCIFNDITQGSNAVPCAAGSPQCSGGVTAEADGSPAYPAGAGYDLATGLGSVNFANLIAAWPTTDPSSTQTALSASATSVQHGQAVAFQVTVSAVGPTPTGTVEILNGSGPAAIVLGTATVQAGAAAVSLDNLPGGSDSISARFVGTNAFAPSLSSPVAVEVSPEASQTVLAARQVDGSGNWVPAQSTYYGSVLALDAAVKGSSGVAADAAGTVAFRLDGQTTGPGALPLNGIGTAGLALGLLPLGSHTFGAMFSGSPSLAPSVAATVNVQVTPAATGTVVGEVIGDTNKDGSEGVAAFVNVMSNQIELPGTTMGGKVTITDPTGATVADIPITGMQESPAPFNGDVVGGGKMTFSLPAGPPVQLTAHYSGDGNFQPSDAAPFSVDDGAFHFSVQQADQSAALGGTATYQITAVLDSPLPGGTVALSCADGGIFPCTLSTASVTLTPQQPEATFTATVSLTPSASALTVPHRPGGRTDICLLACTSCWLLLLAAASRRRAWVLAGAVLLAAGCGGGGPAQTPPPPPPPANPTFAVQVTGVSGIHVNWANLTLTETQ